MKKFLSVLIIFTCLFLLLGCSKDENDSVSAQNENKFINVKLNEDGKIVIDTSDITSKATFVNYVVDDVNIQFIVVRGTDGVVRIAFNTCEVCNPSPNAFFLQKDNYFECQNCGNRFSIDEIGEVTGGCNPAPVSEKIMEDDKIIIDGDYALKYKEKFENWNGRID